MPDSGYSTLPVNEAVCASEPPSAPRAADFPDYDADLAASIREFRARIWDFLPFVMFLPYSAFLFVVLPYPALIYRAPIFLAAVAAILAGIRAAFRAQISRERKLYKHGIATVATVTAVSHNPYSDQLWVQWTYLDGRTGNTPRHKMPAGTDVGDQLWVIYDPENPTRALRWGQFAPNGELDVVDE